MSDPTIVRLLRLAAVVSALLGAASLAGFVATGYPQLLLSEGGAFALFSIFFAVVVWLVSRTQPRNPVVWIMASTALFSGVYNGAWFVAATQFVDPSPLFEGVPIPSELPALAAWTLLLAVPLATGALLTQMTLGLLLFPDGSLPSVRWRWVGRFVGLAVVLQILLTVWQFRPWSTETIEAGGQASLIVNAIVMVAALLSLAALAVRFRGSSGVIRQQFKWVFWGASILILSLVVLVAFEGTGFEEDVLALFVLSAGVFVFSYGMAVGRYGLYGVDVVISRTFVYGTLAVFITGAYVAAVAGLGQLFGSGSDPNPAFAIAGTAGVAVAFQPLRRRLQRAANRMVYGRRATPYEVLSAFSQRVAAIDPSVLGQIAKALAEGTTATSAVIWVDRGAELHRIASWPADLQLPEDVSASQPIPGADRTEDVTHDGERLGVVGLALPPGQPFPPTDQKLLQQVVAGLGLALRNLLLTDVLQTRVDQLRESRRRIVAVQDQTRRALERDLHDGAQQRLVALKIKLGIGASLAKKDGLEDIHGILETVRGETDLTIDSLRELARGIYPPLLEAEGLGPALTTQLKRAPLPVTVQAAGLGRYPRDLEATVYFCVLEAVQNAVKHAQAASAHVALREGEGTLVFEISDDGRGFDPAVVKWGSGLANLADRTDAQDGTLEVVSSPGRGTTVRGTIPSRDEVMEMLT